MTIPNGTIKSIEPLSLMEPEIEANIITYYSEGLAVKAYLLVPQSNQPSPSLIYCRGGINKVGMVRLERVMAFARRGYVVIAPFYRGNEGGEGREDFGGEDRYDVHNVIPVLKQLPFVDDSPISIMGFSRGAIMALFAAMDCPEIGPVVIRGGVSDLWLTYEERIDLRRMMKRVVGRPNKHPEQFDARTPLNYIDRIHSPVLIVHGKNDIQVSVEHAYRLANALKEQRKVYEMKLYEGLGHVFPPEEDKEAMDFIFAWIDKNRHVRND